jgi:hypothetical protein
MRAFTTLGICLAVCLFAGTALEVGAASPKKRKNPPASTPKPSAGAESSGTASMRLWKEDFPSQKEVQFGISFKKDKNAAVTFKPPGAGSFFTAYTVCPSEAATVTILGGDSAGGKSEPIPVRLAPGSFTTFLLREKDGTPLLEVLDDARVGADGAGAELTVRNFDRRLVEIRVQAGDHLSARMRAPECLLNVRGLERQVYQLDTIARDDSGKESRWSTEVDFKTSRKATLLIYSDPYGRVRPRVVLDGQPAPAE